MVTIIDGRNLIHGRLASVVAERIMNGEEIVVLNAEAFGKTVQIRNLFGNIAHVKYPPVFVALF